MDDKERGLLLHSKNKQTNKQSKVKKTELVDPYNGDAVCVLFPLGVVVLPAEGEREGEEKKKVAVTQAFLLRFVCSTFLPDSIRLPGFPPVDRSLLCL